MKFDIVAYVAKLENTIDKMAKKRKRKVIDKPSPHPGQKQNATANQITGDYLKYHWGPGDTGIGSKR